jgi:hypothetical protein
MTKNKKIRSPRAEYASPILEYFNKGNEESVSKLIMENSVDSFRSSLDHYNSIRPLNSNYKHSIILLDHSIETLLKARLAAVSKHKILLNNDFKKDISTLKTLRFPDCIDKLSNDGIILKPNFKEALLDLHEVRNDIWHFGFWGKKAPLDDLISYCSCIYWVFLMNYMPEYGIRPMLTKQQFDTLLSFECHWLFAEISIARIISDWYEAQKIEQNRYFIQDCKECHSLSVILDRNSKTGRCRCCGQEYKMSDFINK